MSTAHHVDKIAPVHMHSPGKTEMQQFTVGKLDAGMAILLGSRASLIEFPSLLLPQDVTAGSVVEISVKRNTDQERRNQREFDDLQRSILDTFGRVGPIAPELNLRALTQTSVVLEWSKLDLATSKLLSLDIYRNGVRLAPIPNALHNTSTKLSGLEVGGEYAFHLVLKTTAGVLTSNTIRTRTHTMTDTSGISVCLGAIDGQPASASDGGDDHDAEPLTQLEAATRQLLTQMGAKYSHKLQIDTTHYVCTSPRPRSNASRQNGGGEGAIYRKALALNIPVVRPEWIVACHEAKRMVPISAYYIDQDPPNHASVQKLLSGGGSGSGGGGGEQRNGDAASARAPSETPPPPAPKDTPMAATDAAGGGAAAAAAAGIPAGAADFSRAEDSSTAATPTAATATEMVTPGDSATATAASPAPTPAIASPSSSSSQHPPAADSTVIINDKEEDGDGEGDDEGDEKEGKQETEAATAGDVGDDDGGDAGDGEAADGPTSALRSATAADETMEEIDLLGIGGRGETRQGSTNGGGGGEGDGDDDGEDVDLS